MKRQRRNKDKIERISITLNSTLYSRINKFISDEGLKEAGITRSEFIQDVLNYAFDDFDKKGKKSILEYLYPED